MNKILFLAVVLTGFAACQKSEFAESYTDPSKIAATSVEKQFAGMIYTNREYVVPSYWNYFVVLRTSVNHYIQAVGWENGDNQYIPPAAGVNDAELSIRPEHLKLSFKLARSPKIVVVEDGDIFTFRFSQSNI